MVIRTSRRERGAFALTEYVQVVMVLGRDLSLQSVIFSRQSGVDIWGVRHEDRGTERTAGGLNDA